ncbi:MAG: nicotinate (nicotinamide) nucleotide adenylyltransferase [Lyngbya sp. HA4199-MV5]|jgi:nicotinate-nucleotide adenylyltransferase|nr:nicotinate (nicotinamide) nucleotide adenylyltransferase [Lyngbya sp. HA4199-MV5]
MPEIAIFGGAFNPVHWGHLLLAETAIDQFQLDRVIWVPTFRSPHKSQSLLAFDHRLEMVRRAIADQPAFTVSAIEGQRQGVSYAIATLKTLQALEPDARWYWIIGSDAFQSLPNWYASELLMAECTWLVAPRIGSNTFSQVSEQNALQDSSAGKSATPLFVSRQASLSITPALQPHWHLLKLPLLDISSTLIRQRCQEGRSIRYLVPESVRCYIDEQNLYQTG